MCGRLTDEDVGSLRRFAELRKIFFSNEVTSADRPFNLVMLEEDVRAMLDKDGKTIGVMDTLIAANALTDGCVLATNNVSHFSRIPGLTLENWAPV